MRALSPYSPTVKHAGLGAWSPTPVPLPQVSEPPHFTQLSSENGSIITCVCTVSCNKCELDPKSATFEKGSYLSI